MKQLNCFLDKQERLDFFSSIDTYITDCDGVLWIGENPIEGAVETINTLMKLEKSVYFVTNNSTKTRLDLLDKLTRLGFSANKENIITSSMLAASYLKRNMDQSKLAYVVGSPGIQHELDAEGIKNFGVGPDPMQSNLLETIQNAHLEDNVGAVVVGFDVHINYLKILKAASYLKNEQCLFVATNTDSTYPAKGDLIVPGTGTMVKSIEICSKREPIIVGKPSNYICKLLESDKNIRPERTIMIGDRCDTDIVFGTRCGFISLLVLTGVHSLEDAERFRGSKNPEDQQAVPNFYTQNIRDILKLLEEEEFEYNPYLEDLYVKNLHLDY